jgi:hypothetical protein
MSLSGDRGERLEFVQLPLVIKETQNRSTINKAEVSALLNSMKGVLRSFGRSGGRDRAANR